MAEPLPPGSSMSSPLSTTPTRVFDLLPYQQAHFPKTDSLAYKVNGAWVKFSTAEVLSIVEELAWGLHLAGIQAGDTIANVTDNNRPEWNFIDLAVMSLGAVHIPIYPNASADDYRFILADARPHLVFVSNQRLFDRIRPLAAEVPEIRTIYTYDEIAGADSWKKLAEAGKTALLDAGAREKLAEARAAVKPED
jgi:long-chain acyl-CoA synthetase